MEAPAVAREAELTHVLYERYSHQLYGFCYAKLGSREEAEDAVQTTFLNAYRGLARGVVPRAESAWLFKIAENVCLSRHRSSFRRRRVESPSDLELLQDVVPAHQHDGDELVGLERVLEKMPESQRRAILLREWQGLSYREIAEEMELTQAAVETLIFRARRSLAQGLASLEGPERETLRGRVRRGADAGGLIAAVKTFFGTALGMKTAATVVAVSSATVIAAAPPSVRHELTGTSHHPTKPAATKTVAQDRAAVHVVPAAGASAAVVRAAPAKHRRSPAPALLDSRRAARQPVVPAESAAPSVSAPAAPTTPAPAPPAPAAVTPAPQPESAPATPVQPPAATPAPTADVTAAGKKKGDDTNGNGRGRKKDVQQAPPPVPVAANVTSATSPAATAPAVETPPEVASDQATTISAPPAEPAQGHRGHDKDKDR